MRIDLQESIGLSKVSCGGVHDCSCRRRVRFRTYQLLYMHKLCIEQMRIAIAAQHFTVLCRLSVPMLRMG